MKKSKFDYFMDVRYFFIFIAGNDIKSFNINAIKQYVAWLLFELCLKIHWKLEQN